MHKTIGAALGRFLPSSFNILDGGFLIITSFLINIISFLYNVYLGRRLGLVDFAVIAVISNMLSLTQIPLGSFAKAIAHRTAFEFGKKKYIDTSLWLYFRKSAYTVSLILTLIWIGSVPSIAQFFKIDNHLPLYLVSPLWIVSVTSSVDAGFLSGLHKFRVLSGVLLSESLGLFAVTIALVETGNKDLLYLGMPAGALISFFFGWYVITKLTAKSKRSMTTENKTFPWQFFNHALITKLTSITFISIDVLLAKHFLNEVAAGEYAVLALVGKMAFYASALLGQFVIPAVSKELGGGKNPSGVFKFLFIPTAVGLVLLFIVLGIYGGVTVPLLFGQNAHAITAYLPLYLVGICSFSLANMIVSYYQSKGAYTITASMVVATIVFLIGIGFKHGSVKDISEVVSLSGFLSLMLALLYRYFYAHTHNAKLPIRAGNYIFIKEIKKAGRRHGYRYGIYSNDRGERALGKFWSGGFKDVFYKHLLQECKTANVLNENRKIKKLALQDGVKVPKVVYVLKDRNTLLVLQEWVEQEKRERRSTTAFAQFKRILSHLDTVSPMLDESQTKEISSLVGWKIGLSYPIVLLRTCVARPKLAKLLLSGAWKMVLSARYLINEPASTLAHRDLHTDNIIHSKNDIFLIDHSYTTLTLQNTDLINLLASQWYDSTMRTKIIKELNAKMTSIKDMHVVRALGIWYATLLLFEVNLSKYIDQGYQKSLEYWINYEK